jgi:hypothetical protein
MTIEEFFELPEEEREALVQLHQSRKRTKAEHDAICAERRKLDTRMLNNQIQCTHPAVVKHHHSDVGNWSKADDCYWTDFECPDCGKRWSEEGSR